MIEAWGSGIPKLLEAMREYGLRDPEFCDMEIGFRINLYMDVEIPEGINIQRYDSVSGEEFNPYRRLSAGDIETIVGGKQHYRALIHKRIPIHSVGIEILPNYYEDFLKKQYPDIYFDLPLERLANIACMSPSSKTASNGSLDAASRSTFKGGE